MKDLRLPLNQRRRFTQPLGKLISGRREDTIAEVVIFFKQEREPKIFHYYKYDFN